MKRSDGYNLRRYFKKSQNNTSSAIALGGMKVIIEPGYLSAPHRSSFILCSMIVEVLMRIIFLCYMQCRQGSILRMQIPSLEGGIAEIPSRT